MSGFITIFLALGIATGCSTNQGLVKAADINTRQDVYQEISPGAPPKPGYADLRIYSSLKTHKPGMYSSKDVHGTPDYKMLITIDGQTAELHSELRRDTTEKGALRDPEAGDGIRYHFSYNIRIKAGAHQAVISIPSNGIAIEREITLAEGSSNSLELEPVYKYTPGKQRPGFYGATSFTEGLDSFKVILNGKPL